MAKSQAAGYVLYRPAESLPVQIVYKKEKYPAWRFRLAYKQVVHSVTLR